MLFPPQQEGKKVIAQTTQEKNVILTHQTGQNIESNSTPQQERK
jgi:hypothetical protein